MRFAGILTALLQQPAPRLVGVEEPELTIHVGAIRLLNDFLHEAAGKQVLVTTHSPELLELVDPDDVRVVTRTEGAPACRGYIPARRTWYAGVSCRWGR